jgi:hypothetical protein
MGRTARALPREKIMRSLVVSVALTAIAAAALPLRDEPPPPAPPFPTRDPAGWIGTPVTWHELGGRVVLVDVWTFG